MSEKPDNATSPDALTIPDAYRGLGDYLADRDESYDVTAGLARFMMQVDQADASTGLNEPPTPYRGGPPIGRRKSFIGVAWVGPAALLMGLFALGVSVASVAISLIGPSTGMTAWFVIAAVAVVGLSTVGVVAWRADADRRRRRRRLDYRRMVEMTGQEPVAVEVRRPTDGRHRVQLVRTVGASLVQLVVAGGAIVASIKGDATVVALLAGLLVLLLLVIGWAAYVAILASSPSRRDSAFRVLTVLLNRADPETELAHERDARVVRADDL